MIRTDGTPTIANAVPLPKTLQPYSAKYPLKTTRERELEAEIARLKRELERVR